MSCGADRRSITSPLEGHPVGCSQGIIIIDSWKLYLRWNPWKDYLIVQNSVATPSCKEPRTYMVYVSPYSVKTSICNLKKIKKEEGRMGIGKQPSVSDVHVDRIIKRCMNVKVLKGPIWDWRDSTGSVCMWPSQVQFPALSGVIFECRAINNPWVSLGILTPQKGQPY